MPTGFVRRSTKGLTYPLLPGAAGADVVALVDTIDRYIFAAWAENADTTQALMYGYKGGTVLSGGAYITIGDGAVPVEDAATNYIERTPAGVVVSNTSGFTPSNTPMAVVVASGGTIQSVQDARLQGASSGGGGGGGIGGIGIPHHLARFTAPSMIGNAQITDDGSVIVMGADPGGSEFLRVGGSMRVGGLVTMLALLTLNNGLTVSSGTITLPTASVAWAAVNKTGSSLADLATRSASDLSTGTLALARGGTGADLSGAGPGFLKQATLGATVTVTYPTAAEITSGAALTKSDDTNVTLSLGGTPASALLAATSLTLGWSGQLGLARGGTGANLSATGPGFLRQATLGAVVTVAAFALTDLPGYGLAGGYLRSDGVQWARASGVAWGDLGGVPAPVSTLGALANAAGWLHNDGAGVFAWSAPAPDTHALLSATHTDTTVGTVLRGDVITGQGASPTWHRLALGTSGYFFKSDGTDAKWAAHGLTYTDVGADVAGAAAAVTPTTLGLVIGTNTQAYSAKLTAIAALTSAAGWLHNDGAGAFAYSTPSKSDVGLSAVENTALSTWAGTTNLTTLGTIVTGVWHGTAIDHAYLSGITAADVAAGTFPGASYSFGASPVSMGALTATTGASQVRFQYAAASGGILDIRGNADGSCDLQMNRFTGTALLNFKAYTGAVVGVLSGAGEMALMGSNAGLILNSRNGSGYFIEQYNANGSDLRWYSTQTSADVLTLTTDGSLLRLLGSNPYVQVRDTGAGNAGFMMNDGGAEKWRMDWIRWDNHLRFYNTISSTEVMALTTGGALTLAAGLTATTLVLTSATIGGTSGINFNAALSGQQRGIQSTQTVTTLGGYAAGLYLIPTLVAAANTDQFYGLFLQPSLTIGGYTSTTAYGIYVAMSGAGTNYAIYTGGGTVAFANAGVVVGTPTGGDKGAGTINVAGGIYLNNGAYTNPDFVLELWATASVVKYADRPRARQYRMLDLGAIERYARANWRLPGISEDPAGIFERGDIALEKIEELYIFAFDHNHRIAQLEAEVAALRVA